MPKIRAEIRMKYSVNRANPITKSTHCADVSLSSLPTSHDNIFVCLFAEKLCSIVLHFKMWFFGEPWLWALYLTKTVRVDIFIISVHERDTCGLDVTSFAFLLFCTKPFTPFFLLSSDWILSCFFAALKTRPQKVLNLF